MDDNDVALDVVPPLPIASSTQFSQTARTRTLPQLPRLPQLDIQIDFADNVEPVASGSGPAVLSPIATSQDQRSRSLTTSPQRSSVSRVQDWVLRTPRVRLERAPDTVFRLQRHHIENDIIEIEDARSGSSTPVSDVISIGESSSVEEIIGDSDDGDVVVLERPASPVPALDNTNDATLQDEGGNNAEAPTSINPGIAVLPATVTEAGSSTAGSTGPFTSTPLQSTTAPLVTAVQILGAQGDSPADFRSPKRRRIISPLKSKLPGKGEVGEEEDDSECCPICFETWTTSGIHRLCALKCGHLFGQSCIEKWLTGQGLKCPQCNAKAKRQDIRVLYAKSIKAQDTSERDRALKDLEKEKEGRRKAEMEGAQLRLQFQMAVEETNKLRLELETLKSQIRRTGGTVTPGTSSLRGTDVNTLMLNKGGSAGQFILDKTIKIWDAGNCRVMAYNHSLATLVVSQPSSSRLFPGFGVKKISTLDFKTSQYITIHSKPIRDVAFHPSVDDDMLLSCGLDKKVKMTSLLSNAVVQSYDTPMPAWSCVWNAEDRNYFYAGLQNGLVMEFDIRNTEEAVRQINTEGSRSPVASLLYIQADMSAEFRSGGLMIGQLDRVSFFENLPNSQHRLHILPLEGILTSLHMEPNTRHILASFRPTARHPTVRHQLCELVSRNISANPTVIDNVCSCNVVHTFHGGRTQTVLAKTMVLQHPGDNNRLLICAGDEVNNSVHVWDSGTGQLTQRLLTGGITVDMCSFTINNVIYLAALTDKQCKVFKWR